MTFARSITLPPPTATITSGSVARPSATAASTADDGTSTSASVKTATSRPAARSAASTVPKPGVPAITGSVISSTRRPWVAATRPVASAIPAPNSTWDGARRTANSVIGGLQESHDKTVELGGVLER